MVGDVVSAKTQPVGTANGFNIADPDFAAEVGATLGQVEELLRRSVESPNPMITEAARHLIDAGGKRFRPLLVVLGSYFGDPLGRGVIPAAAVVELTHLATLYHDDVMDEATVRRGAPSANARWGNSVAILIGDYLFARAADVASDLGSDAVRLQARTFAQLVHGQMAETNGPADGEDPIEHHLQVIAQKTGSLIASSSRLGAMVSGADDEVTERLSEYGELMGTAFQLSDDLLDIASERVQSGKTPGTDLREGIPTLPVLYAMASDDQSPDAVRLREILAGGAVTDPDEHAEALALLRRSDALRQARQKVRDYANRAKSALAGLSDIPARRALEGLCDFIVDRTS